MQRIPGKKFLKIDYFFPVCHRQKIWKTYKKSSSLDRKLCFLEEVRQTNLAPPPVFSALDLISPRGDSLKQDGVGSAEKEDAPDWSEQKEVHGHQPIGESLP
jgi:hypothetical protein